MTIKGIDVSEYQGAIDWQKVAASGVKVAIVRYADGMYIDRYFYQNMAGAIKAGLHVGAYIYSRAINAAQAAEEAQRIIKACEPYNYDMPLYIDLEANNLKYVANTLAKAFMNECKKRGVLGGIYANLDWFNNYLDPMPYITEPLWIAQYYSKITYKNPYIFGMWQYTSSGRVAGIDDDVDLNHVYVEYWKKEKPKNDSSAKNKKIDDICTILAEKSKNTLADKYGTGAAREKALGSYYSPVQWIINEVYKELQK